VELSGLMPYKFKRNCANPVVAGDSGPLLAVKLQTRTRRIIVEICFIFKGLDIIGSCEQDIISYNEIPDLVIALLK